MSPWLKGEPFELDKPTFDSFKHVKKRLHCALCDKDLAVGDKARWIYANGTKGAGTGNFFVCGGCDTGNNLDLIEKAKESRALAVRLAKQWNIYGPDWAEDERRFGR